MNKLDLIKLKKKKTQKEITKDTAIKVIQGVDGKDGYTPQKGVDYFDGEKGKDGSVGKTGEQGLKGDKGDKGEKGDRGERGLKGDKGDRGITGKKGEDGKSAYEIWRDSGNRGSIRDFLNSLKGATVRRGGGAGTPGQSTHNALPKTTPADADEIPIVDSADAFVLKKLIWANLKATLKTYFDGIYQAAGSYITASSTNTLTNKRRTLRTATTNAPGATPTTNTDNVDVQEFTGLGTAITSMTTNLSGTPVNNDFLEFKLVDDGTARAITWGTSFAASGTVALPTTTVISTPLRVLFQYSTTASLNKWVCIATA